MHGRRQLVTVQQVRKVVLTHKTSKKQLPFKDITTGIQVQQLKAECGCQKVDQEVLLRKSTATGETTTNIGNLQLIVGPKC